MQRYGCSFLFGFLFLILAPFAQADMQYGYEWLANQQQEDGSFQTNTDIANTTQATSEVLMLGRLAGASLTADKNAAKVFLAILPYTDTETLSQALMNGVTQTTQGQSIALILKSRQNPDGGFGQDAGYQSTPFDTFWAISALEAAGGWSGTPIQQSISYLLAKRTAQGGWAYQGDVSIYLTARVLSLLTQHTQYGGVTAAINSARQFLSGEIDSTTHLVAGDLFNSAVVLSALVDAGDSGSAQSLAPALLARQDAAGSWAHDSWTTALVLQALLKNSAAGQGGGIAQISGRVVISGSSEPLAGVTVSVIGQNGLQVVTAADGHFLLAGVQSGSVNLAFSRSGYNPVSTDTVLLSGEQKSMGDVPMAPGANTVLLTGVVLDDATTQPIANANVSVTTNSAFTVQTDAKGAFALTMPVSASYQGNVTASGYNTWSGALNLVAGQNTLRVGLLPTGTVQNDQPGTLHGRVIDGATGVGLAGATINAAGHAVVSAADGQYSIENVARGTIAGTVSATNYQGIGFSYPFPAGSSGEMGDIPLYAAVTPPPPATPDTTVSVSGTVTDLSGAAIAGAVINVPGAASSALSAADGSYAIDNIASMNFVLRATAANYQTSDREIRVQAFGHYSADLILQPLQGQQFAVEMVKAPDNAVNADQNVLIDAVVHNISGQQKSALIRGIVFDLNGAAIATLPVYIPGTQSFASTLDFAANETKTLSLPWNTAQWSAGGYSVRVDVVQPGSISRSLPNGVILASAVDALSIAGSQQLSGGFDFNPPMSQAGQQTPVALNTLIRNSGNMPLTAGDYALTIRNSTGGIVHSATVSVTEIAVNGMQSLDFGNWVTSSAGNMSLMLQKKDDPSAGVLTGSYYVGDVANGNFTVDQHIFTEGSHSTQAHINLQGVDLSMATSTDPLYDQVKTSMTKAGNYAGSGAYNWQQSNRCMGCHIQSQALYGLSSSIGKIPVDSRNLNAMYNAIAGDIAATGFLRNNINMRTPETSAFGLWSIDAWPKKSDTYKARVKLLENISRYTHPVAGDAVAIDVQREGWLEGNGSESIYAAIAPAVQHLVDDKRQNVTPGVWQVSDWTVSQPIASFGYNPVYGTFVDGKDIYLARKGGIDKFSTETNQLTHIYTGAPALDFRDVLVDNGVVYATTQNTVIRVIDATTSEVIFNANTYLLSDIVKWNNVFYVVDSYWSNIIKLSKNPDNTFTSSGFSGGGLLRKPVGLTIGENNKLVVANGLGSVVAFDENANGEIIFDGLLSSLISIEYDSQDNVYYFTANEEYFSGVYGSAAIFMGKPDGTVDRLAEYQFPDNYFYPSAYYGIARVNGDIFVTNVADKALQKLSKAPLNDSVIDDIKASVPSMVRYLLQHRSTVADNNMLLAQSMVALSSFRPLLTDAALQAQVDSSVDQLNTLLRSRQHSDGGWGWVDYYSSDATTTAWVGFALDTLNPSVDDPVVRKTITYLLQSQLPDGAWPTGGYFGQSKLGPTGMVLAYLPTALGRLGGLDITVDLQSRSDVQLSAFNIEPNSAIPQAHGGMLYHWKMDGVTGAGRQINFTANINELLPGEVRPVAESASLQFHNSFTDDVITRELAVPTVEAINGVTLNVTTNSSSYPANSVVQITDAFANTGMPLDDAVIKSVIRTADGVVIEGLPDQTGITLANNSTGQTASQWNTGTHTAGAYQVFAQLIDADGNVRAESVSAFTISTSDGSGALNTSYATQVNTDKLLYTPFAPVQIHSRVRNLAVNATQAAVLAKLAVTDSQGSIVLSKQWVVPVMAANGLLDYPDTLPLNDAVGGAYSVSLTLWDATVQQQLASSQYNFIVVADPLAYLRGGVTVSAASVPAGSPVSCTDKIENRSQKAGVDATIETLLVRAADQVVVSTNSQNQHFAAAETSTRVRNIDTTALTPGDYSCVLIAHESDNNNTLGYATFAVTAPDASPVSLDVSANIGQHGRLLVLLDARNYTDALDGTSTAQQKAWLEPFLVSQGWSYTIVHNASDFARELDTGEYMVYGLFANHVTLSKSVQLKLAAAVESGEGLLMSGQFNRRNNHLEKAVGITLTGREQQATGALLSAGVLTGTAPAESFNPAHKLDIDDAAGDVLAVWQGVSGEHGDGNDHGDHDNDHHGGSHQVVVTASHQSQGGQHGNNGNHHDDHGGSHDDHDSDYNDGDNHCGDDAEPQVEPALIHHAYGTGHTVFAGFDLLDEATLANNSSNVYARMLGWSLQRVQPLVLPRTANNALPLSVHVENQGSVTEVRYTLTVNGGVVVVGNGWTNAGNGQWQYSQHLDVDANITLPVVYVTAGNAGAAVVQLLVETRPDASAAWTHYQTENWPVATLP